MKPITVKDTRRGLMPDLPDDLPLGEWAKRFENVRYIENCAAWAYGVLWL